MALHAHGDAHSDVGSVAGSFKLPGMHDFAPHDAADTTRDDMSNHAPSTADVPGVIHGP